MDSHLLRRVQAADYLGVSRGFLEKAVVRGDGPPYSPISRKLVLYDRRDLDAWVLARRVVSTSQPRAG